MGYECYSNKRLKQKLKEKYGDCLTFSESCGRTDILCFKEFANYVLQEKKKEKVEETKESIVKAAAKIIKSEIREVEKSNEYYPTNLEVQDSKTYSECIPESHDFVENHNAEPFKTNCDRTLDDSSCKT